MSLFRTLTRGISLARVPKFYFSASNAPKILTDEITLTDECIQVRAKIQMRSIKIENRRKTKTWHQQNLENRNWRRRYLQNRDFCRLRCLVGCSGYGYNFRFDTELTDEDLYIEISFAQRINHLLIASTWKTIENTQSLTNWLLNYWKAPLSTTKTSWFALVLW